MNELVKVFEGNEVIIEVINGEPMFEIYSTGMALGHTKVAKGTVYPRKERIEENIKNAEITTVVHNGQLFITESQLYDFMLEARTEKCKAFRKWVTTKVLPSIREHGMYMTDNLLEKTLEDPDFMIEILTKYKTARQEKLLAERELESAKLVIIEQQPLVELARKRLDKNGLVGINDVNETFDLVRGRMTGWAKANGYLHKTIREVNEKGKDYFRVYLAGDRKSIGITEEGIRLINENLAEIRNFKK